MTQPTITVVERNCLKYLLKKGKANSAYQICKAQTGKSDQRTFYNRALTNGVDFVKDDRGFWVLNPELYSFMDNKDWGPLFSLNEKIIDLIASKRKMTFVEWIKLVQDFGVDMFSIVFKRDPRRLPTELRKLARVCQQSKRMR